MVDAPTSEQRVCMECGRSTTTKVGSKINGKWHCYTCAHKGESQTSNQRCGLCNDEANANWNYCPNCGEWLRADPPKPADHAPWCASLKLPSSKGLRACNCGVAPD